MSFTFHTAWIRKFNGKNCVGRLPGVLLQKPHRKRGNTEFLTCFCMCYVVFKFFFEFIVKF